MPVRLGGSCTRNICRSATEHRLLNPPLVSEGGPSLSDHDAALCPIIHRPPGCSTISATGQRPGRCFLVRKDEPRAPLQTTELFQDRPSCPCPATGPLDHRAIPGSHDAPGPVVPQARNHVAADAMKRGVFCYLVPGLSEGRGRLGGDGAKRPKTVRF
jgi:hypothetical protein